ncbi:STAM like protein Hse1 [Schizosaccharomyces japonicus yFS275]|uniref:Class E vacuolar protein-sorting machinery protein HSE1 n=1 Tax=Schizosaccharomyces japonicus (strain yFS275 / FY16936) TaxID=402676 RepID=B6JWP3_SCHJY|nr:STAM like protein Hse1 [Schizosaccharomyces japonicus yFS275]EEB05794.1 STAM like protein Hse1 [Schizosaccharomyces japonicus yFS275]
MARRRSASLEAKINQITDENNTEEKWDLILNVCDRVNGGSPDDARLVVNHLIKRFQVPNANVQLYSLSLVDALVKNCQLQLHQEVCSRVFTTAIYQLADSPNVHAHVKSRIASLVNEWATQLSYNANLDLMSELKDNIERLGLTPQDAPDKPGKHRISAADKRREEEELEYALALSLSEMSVNKQAPTNKPDNSFSRVQPDKTQVSNDSAPPAVSTAPDGTAGPAPETVQNIPLNQTPASSVYRVRALYDFAATEPGELSIHKGDIITVLESAYKDWWTGTVGGKTGIFPVNYVERIRELSTEQKQRNEEAERIVFESLPEVEDLLKLLSTAQPQVADDEEIQGRVQQVVSLRPKLIRLLEQYSSRKDELIDLNQRLLTARRDYEHIFETSMSHMRSY